MPRHRRTHNKGARTDYTALEEELHAKEKARNPRPFDTPPDQEPDTTEEEFETIAT